MSERNEGTEVGPSETADVVEAGSGEPEGGAEPGAPEGARERAGKASTRGALFILAGLVVTGLVAGYKWVKNLPKD